MHVIAFQTVLSKMGTRKNRRRKRRTKATTVLTSMKTCGKNSEFKVTVPRSPSARDLITLYKACVAELRLENSHLQQIVIASAEKAKAEVLEKAKTHELIVDDPTVTMRIREALHLEYMRVATTTTFEESSVPPEVVVNAMTQALTKAPLEALKRDAIASGLLGKIAEVHETFVLAERHLVTIAVEGKASALARAKREKMRLQLLAEVEEELKEEMASRNPDEQALLLKKIALEAQCLVDQLKARAATGEDVDLYVMDIMPVKDQRPLLKMQTVQTFIKKLAR